MGRSRALGSPQRWVTTTGEVLWCDHEGKMVAEGRHQPKPLSPTAESVMAMVRQKGRVCSVELTRGQKIATITCLVHRGLLELIPSPDECSPGTVVYYVELPSTVT